MGKRRDRTDYLICFVLIAVTLAVYWQVRGFGFVTLDDPGYVQQNRHVLDGISPSSIAWAFESHVRSNWHPLTWISLMADAQMGGGSPGAFHTTNLALHIANTILLYLLLLWITGYRWRSAVVAALFALHPLHVESVAWVTERKDVLSTLFWLLTMLAYAWYVKRRSVRRYLLVVLAFALGLMAKPMLVSLPLVLLLVDVWPMKRELGWWVLVREKIPLLAMAAASCVVTYWAQATGGSVADAYACPFGVRAANAVVAYASYVGKMVCPLNLSVIYPHPESSLPAWQVIGSALFLGAMLFVSVRSLRKRPYICVGWMWYMLTLLPVIGLVQVGQQAMADRYTYIPLVGLFLILVMGIPEVLAGWGLLGKSNKQPSSAIVILGAVVLAGFTASTYYQVSYWRDSINLFEHALVVDQNNYLAHYNMGLALNGTRQFPEAVAHLSFAAKCMPNSADVQDSLGLALLGMGRVDEAIAHFKDALRADPNHKNANTNLGCAYGQNGDLEGAIRQFEIALRLDPGNTDARDNLARAQADAAQRRSVRSNRKDN